MMSDKQTTSNAMDRLYDSVMKKGPVCVGLDTQLKFLPACLQKQDYAEAEKLVMFNKRVIDATRDNAACFKVQIACYEALGLGGMQAYAETLRYARGKGCVVIADVKRGDIASTGELYARAHFTGDFEADIITINTYMGEDALSPYYPYIERGKGVFVLVKTSNPHSGDVQDLNCNGQTVYERMARLVGEWGGAFIGESGFSAVGAVTGLTYPGEFAAIRDLMPNTCLLIPGYGAQGGTGKDIASFFKDGVRGVVNNSRGLLTAHKEKTERDDYDVYIRDAVCDMRRDIEQWL
ncbi:MAG: orotidine-5'-phosphate decarboxylase [Clostridiales bacterium]|jgi:orotidine-5'-phosphate decarboxylase|nr:orotidine-5'-phosphate decarboxylase [Clostridiales bacterium]